LTKVFSEDSFRGPRSILLGLNGSEPTEHLSQFHFSAGAVHWVRDACFGSPYILVPEARCSSAEAARRRQRNAII